MRITKDGRVDKRCLRKINKLTVDHKLMIVLYETGFSLREIGIRFGLSHEMIRQILMRFGYSRSLKDKISNKGFYRKDPYIRQKVCKVEEMCESGLNLESACYLLSISTGSYYKYSKSRLGWSKPPYTAEFKTYLLNAIWAEFRYLIMISAWNNGATVKELSEIMGISIGSAQGMIGFLRGKGYNLPYRYDISNKGKD